MILTFKLDSNDIKGIKKLISLCENLLSFESEREESKDINIESIVESKEEFKSDIKLEDVRAELVKVANDKGKNVARGLLSEFNVEKLADIKESDYEKLLHRTQEVLSDVTC